MLKLHMDLNNSFRLTPQHEKEGPYKALFIRLGIGLKKNGNIQKSPLVRTMLKVNEKKGSHIFDGNQK